MQKHAYPILEFDPEQQAILEPANVINKKNVPEHCVICFFKEVIEEVVAENNAVVLTQSISEIGHHPLYQIEVKGQRLAFFHPGIGAPLAVGMLEEMIACGCRKFIAIGGCGVLDKEIAVGQLLLPISAIRDEGCSYHYLPPSREVSADPHPLAVIERVLRAHQVEYLRTKTWTTDAIYRETPAKAAAYRSEGCLAVEMETAAFYAVTKFRNVSFGQILYGGDAVIPHGYDGRRWNSRAAIRRNLFWLAAEAVFDL